MLYSHHNKRMEILKATYGTQGAIQDVTKETKTLVRDGQLNFTVSPAAFGILDPAPGVSKVFQANISINKGNPTSFMKNDGEQVAINVPDLEKDSKDVSFGAQASRVIWYGLIALIGTYFTISAYKFGANGLNLPIVGIIAAAVVFCITANLAISETAVGPAGLFGLVISLAFFQVMGVYLISLVYPDLINFNWIPGFTPPV